MAGVYDCITGSLEYSVGVYYRLRKGRTMPGFFLVTGSQHTSALGFLVGARACHAEVGLITSSS
jgi:hypothetical protein